MLSISSLRKWKSNGLVTWIMDFLTGCPASTTLQEWNSWTLHSFPPSLLPLNASSLFSPTLAPQIFLEPYSATPGVLTQHNKSAFALAFSFLLSGSTLRSASCLFFWLLFLRNFFLEGRISLVITEVAHLFAFISARSFSFWSKSSWADSLMDLWGWTK